MEAMRTALGRLASRCQRDSTAFLYVSSHGGRIESGPNAGEYLLPVDVAADLTVSPPQVEATTALSGDEFSEALEAIPARKVVVVFDCCHSGGIGEPKTGLGTVFKSGFSNAYYNALKEGRGRAILASSRSTEYSYVLPGSPNSLFTQHLLAGLQGGIPSDDGLVRIFDLFEYVQPRVTAGHPEQHPLFHARLEENFPVALYLGGQKGITQTVEGDYRYDVYVSYAEGSDADANWVWKTLWPRLKEADLKVAISDDVRELGVSRVVSTERGIKQARRTVIVLSPDYLQDCVAQFESVMAQTMGIREGAARMIPVIVEPFDLRLLPYRLSRDIVTPADLTRPGQLSERQFDKLVRTL